MSVLSGYLVHEFGRRGMFIIEGVPTVISTFVWRRMVEDWPHEATWLDPADREWLERKVEEEQRLFKPVKSYRAAFRSPAVITLAGQYFFLSCLLGQMPASAMMFADALDAPLTIASTAAESNHRVISRGKDDYRVLCHPAGCSNGILQVLQRPGGSVEPRDTQRVATRESAAVVIGRVAHNIPGGF